MTPPPKAPLTDSLECFCRLHAEWVHPALQARTGADLDHIRGVDTNVETQHKSNSCSGGGQHTGHRAVQDSVVQSGEATKTGWCRSSAAQAATVL